MTRPLYLLALAVIAFVASIFAIWLAPPEPFWLRALLTGALVFCMNWGILQVWPVQTKGAQS